MAFIDHLDQHVVTSRQTRVISFKALCQRHVLAFNPNIPATRHRIPSVHNKVHDNLFKLTFIGSNGVEIVLLGQDQSDPFTDQTIQQLRHIRENA